jgi:hypothetical protein
LGTKGWAGSWRNGLGEPSTGVKSTPMPAAQEVKFEEKSGGDAVCAAALATVKAAAMPPARSCAVEANLDIVLSLVSFPTGLGRASSRMNPGGTMYHNHRPEGCGRGEGDGT